MKNKFLVSNLLLAVFAVGCSEGAYTPNNTIPQNQGGMYSPTGIQPGMNQPFMNQPMMNQQGMMNNQSNQAYVNYQAYLNYQAQGMLSWKMRMNLPGFYLNTWRYKSCIPQQSYLVPCTQQTVVRRPCPYTPNTVSTNSNSPVVVVHDHPTTDTSTNTSTSVTTDTSVTTSTVATTNTGTNTTEDTTEVLPISWDKGDAMALYQRLAREEEIVKKGGLFKSAVKARTGDHYKCVVDGSEKKAKNYVCDLEIRLKDGMLMKQDTIGKPGTPEITTSSMFKGELLNIGMPGGAPEVGYLTVAGKSALYLFANMKAETTQGKVEEAGIPDAKIKSLGQTKCYQFVSKDKTTTECVIKIDSSNGKALDL